MTRFVLRSAAAAAVALAVSLAAGPGDARAEDAPASPDRLQSVEQRLTEVEKLLVARLAEVSRHAPSFATALRGYRAALADGDEATASAVLAWLGGQPHVAASARRSAGVRGDLDHFGALGFLQGLLTVLRDSGHTGLFVVLETLRRLAGKTFDAAVFVVSAVQEEIGLRGATTAAFGVDPDPPQVEQLQPALELGGACGLVERRRRDLAELDLLRQGPVVELPKPLEGGVDRGILGQESRGQCERDPCEYAAMDHRDSGASAMAWISMSAP